MPALANDLGEGAGRGGDEGRVDGDLARVVPVADLHPERVI